MNTSYINTIALIVTTTLLTSVARGEAQATKKTSGIACNFEQVEEGQVPVGWKIETTNLKGDLAVWQVIKDSTAPFGEKVLSMTNPNLATGDTFNLCWTDTISLLDGEIEVHFKAVTGEEDQGGGVIWRAQDKDNYYIARFNPEENNFRIYSVHNSHREIMATIDIALAPMKWHTLKIIQQGNRFEGYLNGKKLLEGTDDLFVTAGGVGLWTKADAVTSFDGFSVSPHKKKRTRSKNSGGPL